MENIPEIKVERIHLLNGEGATKAFCDILIYNTFIVKGLRVVNGKDGLFVSMPQEAGRDGEWYSTFYPVTKETYKILQEKLIEAYNERAAVKEA
ncbi:MAG: SpoVG family protein [Candidatus Omnitrophota bacterium]